MPHIIAFLSQTGNVMKTTLAAATGLAFVKAGVPVLAIDLDPEHRDLGASLSTWLAERRDRQPTRLQLDCQTAGSAEEALRLAQASDAAVVLIDCPSRASEGTSYIAAHADFVVTPLVPGDKDAIITSVTLGRIINAGVPADRLAVILTRAGSDIECAAHQAWLEDLTFWGQPIRVIKAAIPERTAYRNALVKRLAITEAQPVSVGGAARKAVDAIIEAFMDATLDTSQTTTLKGAA